MTNAQPHEARLPTGPLGQPHWFGGADRPRFSMLHWPTRPVRGGVVLCPPLAQEAVCAHRSLRVMAERLSAEGFAVMRIDLDGTSNSIGCSTDPDRVGSWRASIVDALDQLRSWEVGPLQLVGLRFGATLANQVAAEVLAGVAGEGGSGGDDGEGGSGEGGGTAGVDDLAGVVLWDPIVSGRRYSRELQLFSSASGLRPPPDGGISLAGIEFDTDALKQIKAVALRALECPTLLVTRTERADLDGEIDLDALGARTELRALPGTDAMLDTDVELSVVPLALVEQIVDWVADQVPARPTATFVPSPPLTSVAHEPVGDEVLVHSARRVGPDDVFMITTTLQGAAATQALIMLNNGLAPSIGPGRAWVELARRAALLGWTAARLDLGGIGDSPPQRGVVATTAPADSYPICAAHDVSLVVDDLRSSGISSFASAGLCSGALLSFDATTATDIDLLISINGRFDRPYTDPRRDRVERAAKPTNRLLAIPLSKTPLLASFGRVPVTVWRSLDHLHLVADPTTAIRRAASEDRQVLLLSGEDEWGLLALRTRGGRRFDRVLADPHVTLRIVDGLDHSMFDVQARREVLDVVLSALQQR